MAFLGALWMTSVALVAPSGDFPLNDDWVYALGVRSILQTGQFELPSPSRANVFAQAYWGATFCLPFGFSFTTLRFSTLTLGVVGIFAFYLLLREVGGNRSTALLGGLTLAINPLYFGLAHTFMTDVPFLALMITALWLFVRGLGREEAVSLSAGILVALADILIRQFALLLLLAFGVAHIMSRSVNRKALLVAIVPLVVDEALLVVEQWVDEHQAADALRMLCGEVRRDTASEACRDEMCLLGRGLLANVRECGVDVVQDARERQLLLAAVALAMSAEVEA